MHRPRAPAREDTPKCHGLWKSSPPGFNAETRSTTLHYPCSIELLKPFDRNQIIVTNQWKYVFSPIEACDVSYHLCTCDKDVAMYWYSKGPESGSGHRFSSVHQDPLKNGWVQWLIASVETVFILRLSIGQTSRKALFYVYMIIWGASETGLNVS